MPIGAIIDGAGGCITMSKGRNMGSNPQVEWENWTRVLKNEHIVQSPEFPDVASKV